MGEWLETPQRKSRKLAVAGLGGSPSGNPNGILPQSPGLRRRFECVACEVCVFRGYGTYIPGGLLFRTREHDPIPPLFVAPPDGHERHNPLRGREHDATCTRGSAAEAQPRALCHNALGVGGGEPRMDVDGMGVDRRRWARTNFPIRKRPRSGDRRFPSGNPKVTPYPIPPPGIPKVVPCPIPPPGIPTGFCHKARGCAAEALPRVKAKNINNPEGVVPMVRMGGM